MKKVINGKVYDTDKAKLIAEAHHDNIKDADGKSLKQWLYRKKTGEFFVHVDGAALELQNIFQHGYKPNAGIYPLTYEKAQRWAERELTADQWENIFGDPEDDETKVAVNLSMTSKEANILKQNAAKADMTVSSYIVMKCTE
jgi:hypothetical protein